MLGITEPSGVTGFSICPGDTADIVGENVVADIEVADGCWSTGAEPGTPGGTNSDGGISAGGI